MTKEKQAEIVLSDETLTELNTEETLLKSHFLGAEKVSAEKAERVKSAKLKSSCLAVVLSAFLGLFGAGSFYLGYWKRGICKILFNVLLPVAFGMVFLYWLAPTYNAYHIAADETSAMIAYEELDAYCTEYSRAYGDVMNRFAEIDKNNNTLKDVYAYVSKEDFETDYSTMAESFGQVMTYGFLQNLKGLSALGEIVSAEDYTGIKDGLSNSLSVAEAYELTNRLDRLTDTNQIEKLIYVAENLTGILSVDGIKNVAADLSGLTQKLDGLTAIRDTDQLYAAMEDITETPVTDRLLEAVQEQTNTLAVLQNLQSFASDLELKFQSLTGLSLEQADKEQDEAEIVSLSSVVAELMSKLENEEDADELIEKLTSLKNNIDNLSASDIGDTVKPVKAFANSDEGKTALAAIPAINSNFNSALTSLNALAVGTVGENGERVCLYSAFADSSESVYTMIHQASLLTEFSEKYKDVVKEYDLFSGLKEFDAQLDFVNVSDECVASMNSACALVEVKYKAYDYTEAEEVIFDTRVYDVKKIMELFAKLDSTAESYTANASNLSSEWGVDSRILTILFSVILAIDGAIIVAYWIGEVFKDRAKCIRDNCEKIERILQS